MIEKKAGYGSHIPILEAMLPVLGRDSALEFGCGGESTPWLLGHFKRVISVETNADWVKKTLSEFNDDQKSRWTFLLTEDEMTYFYSMPEKHGLILVDGAVINARRLIAQACVCLDMAPVVVIHDTEVKAFQYEKIMVPDAWSIINTYYGSPWTAVITRKPESISPLLK